MAAVTWARKALLAVHVIVAVGWIGLDLCLLVLAVTGAVTGDPLLRRAAYLTLGLLGGTLIIPVSVAALVTGITLAAGTRWGLVKYRWVLVSLLLTGICPETKTTDRAPSIFHA